MRTLTLIVSDNSPLNLLIRVGQTHILPVLFNQVLVPPQVASEMRHPKAPDAVRTFISQPPSWLVVQNPTHLLSFPELDPGEVAAISLAVELKAVLMVDEQDGRRAATAHGLEIIGAIGVLERAAKIRLIPDLTGVYANIRSLRFHVSEAILSDSLERVREHLTQKAPPESPEPRTDQRRP